MIQKRHIFLPAVLSMLLLLFSCSDDINIEAFIGEYDVFEECDNTPDWTYRITISEVTNGDGDIMISNFGDFDKDVIASFHNDEIFYNYEETDFTISGSGEFSGNSLTLYYTSAEPDFSSTCTAYCTKQ